MRTPQRVGAGLFALALFTGLAACGDDEEPQSSEATDESETAGGDEQAQGASDEYCEALVEFNGAVNEVQVDESSSEEDITAAGEQLAPLTETLVAEAPDEVADAAEALDGAVQPLTEGDAAPFGEDAVFQSYTELVSGSVEPCGFESTDVTAIEYAFEGVPETLEAGTLAFRLSNEGEEEHEMIIFRKLDGTTESFEEIFAGPEEESEGKIEFAGAAFAPPGEESSTFAELTPGDYAMVCFIPVGGAEDGPPHFTEGMLQEFTVE